MTPQQLDDIIEWDVPNWSQAIKFWEPVVNELQPDAKILAIGERNGGLSLWLTLRGFQVVCTDRILPLTEAINLHQKYSVQGKITYRELDIVNASETEQYDLVILKSVFGGLKKEYHNTASRTAEARHLAIHNIYNLLKPGGYLLTADNMRGSWLMLLFRRIAGKNKGWHYFTHSEFRGLFKSFSFVSQHSFGLFPTLFSSKSLNRLIFSFNKFFSGILPASFSYITFTIARK